MVLLNKTLGHNMRRFLAIPTLLMLLASISSNAYALFGFNHAEPPTEQPISSRSADEYLQMASTGIPEEQPHYQFLAVERLLLDHQLSRASQILHTIQPPATASNLLIHKQLLDAKIHLAKQQFEKALDILQHTTLDEETNVHNRINYHETLAQTYLQLNNIIASIEQRSLLDAFLPTHQQFPNYQAIWQSIENQPLSTLDSLMHQQLSPNTRGWLSLATICQQNITSADEFKYYITSWQQHFPNHPGNFVLPNQRFQKNTHNPAHNIFLLVPLHGKFAKNGQAIRDGFMTAYYQHKIQQSQQLQIHVMDTNDQDVTKLYQEAINQHADFVVGPLTKVNIQQLIKRSLPVPTLVLNQVNTTPKKNLYLFGLSQQQEAIQIANKARKDGHQRGIVIAPAGQWGQSIAAEFQTRWLSSGGEIVDTMSYHNQENLAQQIRELLHVNKSESRAEDLQKLLKQDLRFVPRRRQDVDFIFLVATPKQAKTLRPMLKFYFAGDLPIYATSLVHNGHKNTDTDLDNILFAQMPWLIGKLPQQMATLQQQAEQLLPESSQLQPKFFALGVDAYHLTYDLTRLTIFPRHGIVGATGTLYLLPNQQIYRQLKWAEFKQGHTTLLQ